MTCRWVVLVLVACATIGCDAERDAGDRVTVFAAASLGDVMTRLAHRFTQTNGVPVATSFASSAVLARQISRGAPADVFCSANPKWMDYLEVRDLVRPETRRDLLGNRLVWIVPRDQRHALRLETSFAIGDAFNGRLALGDPDHVPAGAYARSALSALGWWETLSERVVPAQDARGALAYVETGEVGAGIVYATDARVSSAVEVLDTLPDTLHPPIRYPVAAVAGASAATATFLEFLSGPEAARVFREAGFIVLTPHED